MNKKDKDSLPTSTDASLVLMKARPKRSSNGPQSAQSSRCLVIVVLARGHGRATTRHSTTRTRLNKFSLSYSNIIVCPRLQQA
jgi:hypothetical protein